MIKRIAITGPESTGKSELAKALAKYYNTIWVPEFARSYLENLSREYTYDDILLIAKKQYELVSKQVSNANKLLFCDTELIVTKIWCEYKYGQCHSWILNHIENQNIDLYLLSNIDLPWQPDPLREHPDNRSELFDLYLNELKTRNLNYRLVSGAGENRVLNAINIIDNYFS